LTGFPGKGRILLCGLKIPNVYKLPLLDKQCVTRILPWRVPGPPLLRNRGPERTLGGKSYSLSMTIV